MSSQPSLPKLFVLYCIDRVVIAAQCTATLLRSIVLPRIWVLGREYCRLNYAQRPIFSGLRFFNEPEISDSGPPVVGLWNQDRKSEDKSE